MTIASRDIGTAIVLAAALLALPGATRARCQAESVEMPVKMVGSRAVATVGINGTQVPLTVDSGADFSMLTEAAAQQLNLRTKPKPGLRVEGVYGRVEVRSTIVDKLELLKGEVPSVEFIVGGNEPGAGTMGLLGRNILSIADTEYDLAHGAVRVVLPNDDCGKAGMAYWAAGTPVVEIDMAYSRSKTPQIRVPVKLNGVEATALLDTGATTVVSARAARRAGIPDADLKPAGMSYGAGRGSSRLWTASFASFQLGGETISNTRLRVADFDMADVDMLLGVDYFLSHRIYVSKQQSKLFLTYNGDGPVFNLDRPVVARVATTDPSKAAPDATASGESMTADQLARRGAAAASRRNFEAALADLDRACALEPANAAHFAQRGVIHEALRHREQAVADFDQALSLDPALVDARFRRAAMRVSAKDREGAKADLDALDATLAPQASMRLPMSTFYVALDQPSLALAQLNQWLAAHPKEIGRDAALNRRCWVRMMLGSELDRALDDCDEALDASPKNAAYLDSRGWVQLRLGKPAKAVADFDRSLEQNPKLASALHGRGLAHARAGDAAKAEADLAAARKAQPEIDARMARFAAGADAAPRP